MARYNPGWIATAAHRMEDEDNTAKKVKTKNDVPIKRISVPKCRKLPPLGRCAARGIQTPAHGKLAILI